MPVRHELSLKDRTKASELNRSPSESLHNQAEAILVKKLAHRSSAAELVKASKHAVEAAASEGPTDIVWGWPSKLSARHRVARIFAGEPAVVPT